MVVRRMSSGRAHNEQVRVLVVEDHLALANRIGEGLRDTGFQRARGTIRLRAAACAGPGTTSA